MSGENVGSRRRDTTTVTAMAVAAAGVAAVGWAVVDDTTSRTVASRWLLVTGVVLVYEIGFLAYHIDAAPPGAAVEPPNLVTMGRGLLYAATAGFLVVPPSTMGIQWAPAACYGVGASLDFVDGRLARSTGRTTSLGAKLDHAFDTLGFLVAPLVGVAWGRLPVAYLSLSAARYVYRASLGWRRRQGRTVADLPESRVRRPLAALQMAFIAVALAPVVPAAVVHPASLLVVTPSLVTFGRDYLAVTGRLGDGDDTDR